MRTRAFWISGLRLPRASAAITTASRPRLLHYCGSKHVQLSSCSMLRPRSYSEHGFPLLQIPFFSTFARSRCVGSAQCHFRHATLCRESTMSDTKKAALEVGKGGDLVAFYADNNVVSLPTGHRFPMDKYRATRLKLEDDASLVNLLTTRPSPVATIQELCLVHEERYVHSILHGELSEKEQRTLGFPWSPELVNRSRASTGGTIAAMHCVMLGLRSAAANIAGGTHHAFPDHGEGFCVFNDIAVAARVALEAYPQSCSVERPVLVIDLDVHQGNGTAKIFEEDNRVVTFSMHGENNYPWRTKMKSDYDVDLPDDTGDKVYLAVLSDWLQRLFSSHSPSLIFFQAGVDALREDSFGRLAMTRQGLLQRNNMVYSACLTRTLPLVITMGGGYSRPSEVSVQAHADVYRAAALRYGAVNRTFSPIS